MRPIVPIADLGSRMPEHGRIRLGVKTGRAMKSIDTFRFTSGDEPAIFALAGQLGGSPQPWDDPKAAARHQWEVVTQANELDIFLPSNALSTWYETWAGGGVTKRCDGVMAEVPSRGQEEMVSVSCLCAAEGNMTCRPYSRLNVIIPTIRFGGVWRLETKGWNAAAELPGMEEALQSLQANGLVQARLSLQQRQSKGGSKRFVVPVLSMAQSPNEILSGAAVVGRLASAPVQMPPSIAQAPIVPLAIEAPVDPPPARTASSTAWYDDDEPAEPDVMPHGSDLEELNVLLVRVAAGGISLDVFGKAVAYAMSGGDTDDTEKLTKAQVLKAMEILPKMSQERMQAAIEKYEGRPL